MAGSKDIKNIEKIFHNGIVYSLVKDTTENKTYMATVCDSEYSDMEYLDNMIERFRKE
jgi:hypothetical protein